MTAIDIIKAAWQNEPAKFLSRLRTRRMMDLAFAESKTGSVVDSIRTSVKATERAIAYLQNDAALQFTSDMAAGIIALHFACKIEGYSAAQRTSAAVAQWGDK